MPDFKLLGDTTNPVVTEAGNMLQGIGFPLRPVDGTPPNVNPMYGVPAEGLLSGVQTAAVTAVAVDTPTQIPFGPAQSLPEVDLSAAGTLTFTPDGVGFWAVVLVLNIARQAGGQPAKFFMRPVVNGFQAGAPVNVDMGSNSNVNIPFAFTFFFVAADVDEWKFEFHTQDDNDPGLHVDSSNLWGSAPAASITLYKFKDIVL